MTRRSGILGLPEPIMHHERIAILDYGSQYTRLIDPAGNRVHSEDNLPYDPSTLPVQRPMPLASDAAKAASPEVKK